MLSGMCIDDQCGHLIYDPLIGRPLVAFARGGYSDELHCGQPITLVRGGTAAGVGRGQLLVLSPGTGLRTQYNDLVYLP